MDRIEKIKVAIDVAIYYFIITTLSYLLSRSYLIFKIKRSLFGELNSNALKYSVLIVIILFLIIFSNVLKRKVKGGISPDSKSIFYLIVGMLLIIDGVINIATYVSYIRISLASMTLIDKDISQAKLMHSIYFYYAVPLVIYPLQIGIGAYFTFMTIRRDKQIEETNE
ncbi:hypothetical protein [Clostridium sp.]